MKYSSANLKLTKTQLSKIVQSRRFLGRIPRTLMRPDLLLIKIVLKSLAKSVFIPLGLTVAASTANAEIHKKNSLIRGRQHR